LRLKKENLTAKGANGLRKVRKVQILVHFGIVKMQKLFLAVPATQ